MTGFSPPGRLRLLGWWLGDLLYGVLISFGWEPREAREKAGPGPQEPGGR